MHSYMYQVYLSSQVQCRVIFVLMTDATWVLPTAQIWLCKILFVIQKSGFQLIVQTHVQNVHTSFLLCILLNVLTSQSLCVKVAYMYLIFKVYMYILGEICRCVHMNFSLPP